MTKRGIDLGGEFRYLERELQRQGARQLHARRQPARPRRWGYAITHRRCCRATSQDGGPLGLNLNLNRVSDDNYWRDFSAQRQLADAAPAGQRRAAVLGHRAISPSARGRLNWQTCRTWARPSCRPTTGLPQLVGRYGRTNLAGGLDASSGSRLHALQSVRALTCSPTPAALSLAQISRPWQAPGWFVTPKLQLHSTQLPVRRPLTNGATPASRDPAHLQPGQRPGVRARCQLLWPQLPPDAGAAGVLCVHALP
jgi:LPS-assembly protein